MTWIATYTGTKFDLLKPRAEDVHIADIVQGLSNTCRFNGHTKFFYSVAQHSLLVASYVPQAYVLEALLHDAHEVYVGDIVRPLKQLLPQHYSSIEDRVDMAVRERFGLPAIISDAVKEADERALFTEKRDVLSEAASVIPWEWSREPLPTYIRDSMHPETAARLFAAHITKALRGH